MTTMASAVTGLTEPEILRVSHIKPWAKCDSDRERLNVFNGLLLRCISTQRLTAGSSPSMMRDRC